jgi:2-iminobutanoate/2-iminopropanoate deaminase
MTVMADGVTEQTERVFANLRAILTAAQTDLARVVKATVYLTDMADFSAMNAVYEGEFAGHRPARSTVAVASLPKGVRVEIDLIAEVG